MNSIQDILKKLLPPLIAIPLILQITILAGMSQLNNLVLSVYPNLKQTYEGKPLLTITILAALSCLLWLFSYLVLFLKYRNKLKPRFGILWDKNKEPHCPSCQIPLSEYYEQKNPPFYGFTCVKCNPDIRLQNNGKPISLSEAKKLI